MEVARQWILVVDDEEDICEILRFNLESEGFGVDCANSAEEALWLMESSTEAYCLILLDVMMQGMSGLDMARQLRGGGISTPIIFLTALGEHDDQLRGFDVGADDYIAKPFSFDMVLARIRAVLRRTGPSGHAGADGLTKREHLILQFLSAHRGQFLSRQEIIDAVWPGDTFVGERSVDVHIARLRKKLGDEGGRIVNKTGFGYGLV